MDPRAWLARGRRRRPPDCWSAPTRSRSAASSTGWSRSARTASRCATRCSGTTPGPRPQAAALIAELGGPQACADAIGSVLVASFTVTKLRWLRDHEPDHAERVAEVLLPHDYVARHLSAPGTDRVHRPRRRLRHRLLRHPRGRLAARPGQGRARPRAAAAARRSARRRRRPHRRRPADRRRAPATTWRPRSGWTCGPATYWSRSAPPASPRRVSRHPVADGTGVVTGFADATRRLPADGHHDERRRDPRPPGAAGSASTTTSWPTLALTAPPGSNGVTLLPYYGGERTPNRPDAVGTWTGLTPRTTRADLARAAFEALLCSLADAVDALLAAAGDEPRRVLLVGGAARSPAVRALAPAILGRPVVLPPPGEYVARGAARQAAWALLRRRGTAGVAAARHRDARGRPDPRRTRALRRAPRPPRTSPTERQQ